MSSNCQTCTKRDTCIIFAKINTDTKTSLYSSAYNLTCDLNKDKSSDKDLYIVKKSLIEAINRLSSIANDVEDTAEYLDTVQETL